MTAYLYNRRRLVTGVVFCFFIIPLATASAQFGKLDTFMTDISSFINGFLVPFVFAIALLVFLWGVFRYFIAGGADEGKREEGRKLMLYAIIGFVLMVSIWGIVNLLAGSLFGNVQTIQKLPNAPGS